MLYDKDEGALIMIIEYSLEKEESLMQHTMEETYGKLLLTKLFTHVWFGDWGQYENSIKQFPNGLVDAFPFHPFYDRKITHFWYDNYFLNPGTYFIPLYVSHYITLTNQEKEQTRQDLIQLTKNIDEKDFPHPLDIEKFPDHVGSLTAFIAIAAKKEVEATKAQDNDLAEQMVYLQKHIFESCLEVAIKQLWYYNRDKIQDPFFKEFIPFYLFAMEDLRYT